MNHLHRTLGCITALTFLALTPYCEDVYRWPKAQLFPPEPVADAPAEAIVTEPDTPEVDDEAETTN